MMKKINFLIQRALLLLAIVMVSFSVLAEGSKDLYPAGSTGGRAALVTGASNPASWPFPTEGDHYVYAKVGDVITIASSLQSLGASTAQRVKLFDPYGVEISLTIDAGDGNIPNRAAEIAGPKKPGHTAVGDEYTALEYTVQAGEEGIFKVQFLGTASSTSSGRKTHSADEEWAPQHASTPYIQAWDVSVFDTGTDNWVEGRVYVNVFNLAIWTMGKTNPYAGGFESEVKVLTKDGFVYNVDNNGQNGIWFTFYVNNKGFYDGANQTPLYKSVNNSSSISNQTHDPRSPDANGNITHKIFYNIHDQSMPEAAIGGPTPGQPTWLNPDRVLITISNVGAVGLEGTPGQMSQKGGYIVFDSDANGGYTITISPALGSAPFEPRILTGIANSGHNDIYFDGFDGNGVPIPDDAEMGLDVKPQGAEVHFPYIDVEVNPDGLIIQLLTEDLLGIESDIIYWNDEDLGDTSDGPSSPKNNSHLKNPPGGVSSALGEHKWGQHYNLATGNASGTGTFGDDRGIDTWTFVEGTTISSSSTFQVMISDLSIEQLIADKTDCELIEGDRITYTIKAKNNGPKDVDSSTFVFKLPTGFTDGAVITFNGNGCGNEKIGYELAYSGGTYRSVLDLPDGCEVTYTIEAIVGANTDAVSVAEASIIRPKDVTDPDATNPALDDGAGGPYIPSDAHEECSNNETPTTPTPQYPYGCNNIMEIELIVIPYLEVENAFDPTECEGEGSIELAFTNVPDGTYDLVYDGGVWTGVEVSNGVAVVEATEGNYENIKIVIGGCTSADGVSTSLTDPDNPEDPVLITEPEKCTVLGIITIEEPTPAANLTYTVTGPNGYNETQSSEVFSGLEVGTYEVIVVEANCSSGTVSTTITYECIIAEDDEYTGYDSNGGTTGSVFENDTLNGQNPINTDDITFTPDTVYDEDNNPTGNIIVNPDGTVTITPGTPNGTYTFTYEICDVLIPTNCDTATVTIIVEGCLAGEDPVELDCN